MKRKYEIGFIISPETEADEMKKIVDSIAETVAKGKGVVENIDEWGRRKFAYPINGHLEGNYYFINAEAEGTAYAEVERRLKLSEKILRFIIIRLDDKLKKTNRLTKKWKKMEKMTRKAPAAPAQEEAEAEEFSK